MPVDRVFTASTTARRAALVAALGLSLLILSACGSDDAAADDVEEPAREAESVIGGYFEDQQPVTVEQVAAVRSEVVIEDTITDDDVALSIDPTCEALSEWPIADAKALLERGEVINPDLEWLVAPQMSTMLPTETVAFIAAAQSTACPGTDQRLSGEGCEAGSGDAEDADGAGEC